ncbi:MAG TPA: MFS transporter, partial [Candidatus Dormibacteraeota bacterium]|nr:MFS transporter [Candidatus Dormibacteraeota bacterium]
MPPGLILGRPMARPSIGSLLRLAAVDTRPLRRRDFSLLFCGQLVSHLGTMVTAVAVPFQLYQLTHSSLAVGLLGVVLLGPVLAFAFMGGALADARDRRLMVLLTELAFMVCSALLLANALLGHAQLWAIYGLAAVQAGLYALQRPSLDALLPRLVPEDEVTAAGSLTILRGTAGAVAGPALAGILIAAAGLPIAYGVDVLTFAVSLVALALMRATPPPPDAERPSLRRVAEGLRYARGRPDLLGTYAVDMVAMFFGMPEALFPAVASGLGGPAALGLLFSAPAFGAMAAFATSGWTGHVHRHGWGVILAATAWGLAIVGFGFARSLPIAIVCLAAAGAADAVSGIFRMAIWNRTIPDSLRGRLASIELLSYTTGPLLGNAESGVVAALAGVRGSIVSGGVLCVAGCLACALLMPEFRQFDARDWTSGGAGAISKV